MLLPQSAIYRNAVTRDGPPLVDEPLPVDQAASRVLRVACRSCESRAESPGTAKKIAF